MLTSIIFAVAKKKYGNDTNEDEKQESDFEKAEVKYERAVAKRGESTGAEKTPKEIEEDQEYQKAWEKYKKYLLDKEGSGSTEAIDENGQDTDEQDANLFQKLFKDQDPVFLQQTTEQHLVHAGYGAEGALLVTSAATVVKLLEVVGPYVAALLL